MIPRENVKVQIYMYRFPNNQIRIFLFFFEPSLNHSVFRVVSHFLRLFLICPFVLLTAMTRFSLRG